MPTDPHPEAIEAIPGIESFIDELSDMHTSPLTPKGRDYFKTLLLAFAAHVKRPLRSELDQVRQHLAEAQQENVRLGKQVTLYDTEMSKVNSKLAEAEAERARLKEELTVERQKRLSLTLNTDRAAFEADVKHAEQSDALRTALSALVEFTEDVMITFRNYYAQAIPRSQVEAKMDAWLSKRQELATLLRQTGTTTHDNDSSRVDSQ